MAEADFFALIDKLRDDPDPKVRRGAARELGALRNPDAISFLVQAYRNDGDGSVQQAARDALLIYRRMEYEGRGETPSGGGGVSSELAGRLRNILTVVLVLTLVGNAGLFVAKTILNRPPGDVVLTAPTPREELTAEFEARLAQIRAEIERPIAANTRETLRTLFTTFQTEIEALNKLPKCQTLDPSALSAFKVADLNAYTYPDLGRGGQELSQAVDEFLRIRNAYARFCAFTTLDDLKRDLDIQPGGAQTLVQRLDELGKKLDQITDILRASRESPLPTRGPTATPIPTDVPTLAPTPTGAEVVVQPTAATTASGNETPPPTISEGTPLPPPTAVPTPTATPIPEFIFRGLGLEVYQAVQYRFEVKYEGRDPRSQEIIGGLQLTVTRRETPLVARYGVAIRDRADILVGQNYLAPSFNVIGQSSFTIKDGVIYQVDPTKGTCAAFRATDARLAAFNDPGFVGKFLPPEVSGGDINALNLQLTQTVGNLTTYEGAAVNTTNEGVQEQYTIRAAVYSDTGVLQAWSLTRKATAPAGYTRTILTDLSIDYTLINVDNQVNTEAIAVELQCANVRVQ
ncbi:MAG TPA: HEAT repeat domain-containing protein [Aggregatilineales bacterium]|nr:HEAT repeat domain-containing protein [Anaerolineales bacterium]HRE47820.1 HEAT repeat domain-containing protein [Aggregatilineales bacterium]